MEKYRPEQELKYILGRHVRTRRENRGWTQEYLAEKARVSKNTICDIETGLKFARARTLMYLAKAFETEVYELLKPKNVTPDNVADIVSQYGDELIGAVEKITSSYIENLNLKIKLSGKPAF